MKINPQIFREYDIRGIVDKDLTGESVKLLTQGIIRFLQDQPKTIVVGRDNRLSSKGFRDILVEGLVKAGFTVKDVGEVPTPVLYYALRHFSIPTGVMITGSHNPPEYNGFKVAINNHCIWGKDIQKILGFIEADEAVTDGEGGSVEEVDATEPYIEEIAGKIKLARPLKVITDAGNGMAGGVAPRLLKKMGAEVIELYSESDGTYPNHHPDPTQPKEYAELMKRVVDEKADIGLAYDGDADRLGSIDETGRMIFGDEMMILFSREILAGNPGAKVCMEVKCSQGLVEDIEAHGGVPHMTPTGHSIIEDELEKTGALLAGEMSGHLYFNDIWYGFDDSIYSGARLLRILSNTDKKFSQLFDDAPKYFSTPELRVEVPDEKKFQIVKEIKEHFSKEFKVIAIDGVRFMTENGWGLVRASNTQPALVIRAEAKTEEELDKIKGLLQEQMTSFNVQLPG